MITGETKDGFKFTIEDAAIDDMELLEALKDFSRNDDLSAVPEIFERLLGSEQKKALYEFVRDPETGRVRATKASEILTEIFDIANAAEDTGLKNC